MSAVSLQIAIHHTRRNGANNRAMKGKSRPVPSMNALSFCIHRLKEIHIIKSAPPPHSHTLYTLLKRSRRFSWSNRAYFFTFNSPHLRWKKWELHKLGNNNCANEIAELLPRRAYYQRPAKGASNWRTWHSEKQKNALCQIEREATCSFARMLSIIIAYIRLAPHYVFSYCWCARGQ